MLHKLRFFLILIIIMIAVWSQEFVYAEEQADKTDPLAVVIVIDTSGSMSSTDPANYRENAANIFVNLLSAEDYFSILTFDTDVKVVQPVTKVQDYNNRETIKDNLLPYLATVGDTNYKVALEEAASQLDQIDNEKVKKAILFITDGKPDPDPSKKKKAGFMNQYMESLWDTVDILASKQYPVYSIGFSDNINSEILDQISTKTDGGFQILDNSSLLSTSLFYTLDELKNRTDFIDRTIDLEKNSMFQIPVDEATSQALILILGEDNQEYKAVLDKPDQVINSKLLSIKKYDGYTTITVDNRNNEAVGIWNLKVEGKGEIRIIGSRDVTGSLVDQHELVLANDFSIKEEGYRIGEKASFASYLTQGGKILSRNKELEITNYDLIINSEDGLSEKIPLYDDGQISHNDFVKNDGIWSNSITLQTEAVLTASIYAKGIYKNKDFTLEKRIGTFQVFPLGKINISSASNSKGNYLMGMKGDVITFPVKVESNSKITENLLLSLEGDIGTLLEDRITIPPGDIVEYPIKILLGDNKTGSVHNIKIKIAPENTLTVVNVEEIGFQVEYGSPFSGFIKSMAALLPYLEFVLMILGLILVIFIIPGKILYFLFFHHIKAVNIIFTYFNKDGIESVQSYRKIHSPSSNKKILIISFNPDNDKADFHIEGTRYDYDLIVSSGYHAVKFDFIEGWKALFQKAIPIAYHFETTIPGVLEKDGKVYTSIRLKENEEVESGGYIFRYAMPAHKSKKVGRNKK